MSKVKPPRAVIEQPEIIITDNVPLQVQTISETIKRATEPQSDTDKRGQYNTMLKPSTVERLRIAAAKQKTRNADIIETAIIKYLNEIGL